MLLNIIFLIIGFILLIKGADIFVDGASSIARNLKVSRLLIGLTIVTFGTGIPELAVSTKSIISNNSDMLLGNVIGSNIINILLILGISSIISPLKVKSNTIYKEIPMMILISLLLVTLFVDNLFDMDKVNMISRSDGIVILLFFLVFVYYLISIIRKKTEDVLGIDSLNPKYTILKSIIFILVGVVLVILGSNFVVDNASIIAKALGFSKRIIGISIIALGTSLPELVTSIVAAKKRENDLLLGNIIGSNIFNIGIVLGFPVAIFGGISAKGFSYIDLIVLLISSFMLLISAGTKKEISKKEGIVMLLVFIIYYTYIIF